MQKSACSIRFPNGFWGKNLGRLACFGPQSPKEIPAGLRPAGLSLKIGGVSSLGHGPYREDFRRPQKILIVEGGG